MANVEPIAPTIDFEALLQPIPGDNPSGLTMRYVGSLYDDLKNAREFDDPTLAQGKWQTGLKVADYKQVITLAIPALSNQTKDLQIAVQLCEALASQQGFAGLRDGIKLIRRFEEDFWESLHPVLEDDDADDKGNVTPKIDEEGNPTFTVDMEGRAGAIEWLDNNIPLIIRNIPFTVGEVFTYAQWEESRKFDFPEDIESLEYEARERYKALKAQAETEKRKTADHWRRAVATNNRTFCETLNLTLEECFTELNELDRANEERFDRNNLLSINKLKNILSSITSAFSEVLAAAREREPWDEPVDDASGTDPGILTEGGQTTTIIQKVVQGEIQSRKDALDRLNEIAKYFRKNEPNSPLPSLIERAIKWGNMPFDVLLQDMVKDDGVIFQVRQTLGFNTVDPSDS